MIRLHQEGHAGLSGLPGSAFRIVRENLSINYYGHVAPVSQKLHDLLTLTSQLRPPGASLGILFNSPQSLSMEREVYLAKMVPRGSLDEIALAVKFDNLRILDENLPPHTCDHLIEAIRHLSSSRVAVRHHSILGE